TTFDLYIEELTQFILFQTYPDNPFANLPISQIYQENNQDLEFNTTQVQFSSCLPLPFLFLTTIRLDQPFSQSNTPPPN
ncbi:13219_t:CDS:2, partial [Gigaspora margarita]